MIERVVVFPCGLSCLLAAFSGCVGPPAAGPAQEAAKTFQRIGAASIPSVLSPEDYVLVGCAYTPGDGVDGRLVTDEKLSRAPAQARADLAKLLARLEDLRSASAGGRSQETRTRPVRKYDLSVARRWILDIRLAEPAAVPGAPAGKSLAVTAGVDGHAVRFSLAAPDLIAFLRKTSYQALRRSMTRPHIAEPWHAAALAGFLALDASSSAAFMPRRLEARRELRGEIVRLLLAADDPEPLAAALLPLVRIFSPGELDSLEGREAIALRVLTLTSAALRGNRASLSELLKLSLEYFGKGILFARAAAVLFPSRLNPALHNRYPRAERSPVEALALLRDVTGQASRATFRKGQGWVLAGEAPP